MGRLQTMEWGSIDWVFEPAEGAPDNMRIGISTVNPGTVQPRHIHYGDEQLMYVLSGHGRQRIGEEESVIEPGKIFHISTGMAHESSNDGTEPIVKLLVSIPAVTAAPKMHLNESEQASQQETIDRPVFLRDVVRELFQTVLAPLQMPVSIFDENLEPIYKSAEFPRFCCARCGIDSDLNNCRLIRQKPVWTPPMYEGASACVCAYGIWVYTLPIVCEGELLGYIQAGHVRTDSGSVPDDPELPYQVPESTVRGIVQVVHRISESICNHYQECRMQVELQHSVRVLSDQKKIDELLKESLKTSQNQTFNLQINQHFLFNTLNTIAGMAIRENALQTYESIGDLAQLLRYTLRTTGWFVTLSEEIDYVQNYTNLQKLRFGNRLKVNYRIPAELMQEQVAFNFLQPVVENCFKHGFRDKRTDMRIEIVGAREGSSLLLCVRDNGSGMTADELEKLRYKICSADADHGTQMVVQKLRSLYGECTEYLVDSDETGTAVTIRIPLGGNR